MPSGHAETLSHHCRNFAETPDRYSPACQITTPLTFHVRSLSVYSPFFARANNDNFNKFSASFCT